MSSKSTEIFASTAAVLILAISVFVMPMQSAKGLVTARTLVFPIELKGGVLVGKQYACGITVKDAVNTGAQAHYVFFFKATSSVVIIRPVEHAPLVFIPGPGTVLCGLNPDADDSGVGADADSDFGVTSVHVVAFNLLSLTYTYSNALITVN